MRIILAIIKKEWLQLMRNRVLAFFIFAAPIVILAIIPFSLEGEVNIKAGIVDEDESSASRRLIAQMNNIELFQKVILFNSREDAQLNLSNGNIEMLLVITSNFEYLSVREQKPELLMLLDGTAPYRAKSIFSVISGLLESNEYNIHFHKLFNRAQSHKHYFLLSLIILVILLVGTSLMTLNIVNEKESGILEQFNATLLNRYLYIFSKYLFFIILSLFELIICLFFCFFVYKLTITGTIFEVFISVAIFMFPMLSIGFLIAVLSSNQVQSVYMLTFILLNLILLGTMFTQLSSMPMWAQNLTLINPLYYILEISRNIVFKGTPLLKMLPQLTALIVIGFVVASIAVLKMSRSHSRW